MASHNEVQKGLAILRFHGAFSLNEELGQVCLCGGPSIGYRACLGVADWQWMLEDVDRLWFP